MRPLTLNQAGKIDVFIPTRNSGATLPDCLNSIICADVPINRLVVVDAFSQDNTLAILSAFCGQYKIPLLWIQDRGGLGRARHLANQLIETDVYLSLDSDVNLISAWYPKIRANLDKDPDLVYAGAFVCFGDPGSLVRSSFEYYRKIRNTTPVLCATLIRRDKADFSIMDGVHVGEDTLYNFQLVELGGKYLIDYENFAVHPSTVGRDLKHVYGWGRGSREIGRHPAIELARLARAALNGCGAYLELGEPLLVVYMPLREFIHLIGYVQGRTRARPRGLREEIKAIKRNRQIVGAKGL